MATWLSLSLRCEVLDCLQCWPQSTQEKEEHYGMPVILKNKPEKVELLRKVVF